ERYRVTSIKMQADGRKQTFILDKKDGITRGFTPQEIEQRTPEMLRLQRRGENLYYTPLSDKKHHILIDDMNREKLERLIRDGYRPAVVLESSPGNYQAIITVPKLGTAHDKDVGNRLSDALNREYGDPKLSGAIHPHRAPGYENRKPKHQREDGSYPEVRLLKAERRECVKALALSSQIDAEYQRQAALKAQQPERSKAKP
ncbi:mobilization protein, partial [Enterobacter asburiae]